MTEVIIVQNYPRASLQNIHDNAQISKRKATHISYRDIGNWSIMVMDMSILQTGQRLWPRSPKYKWISNVAQRELIITNDLGRFKRYDHVIGKKPVCELFSISNSSGIKNLTIFIMDNLSTHLHKENKERKRMWKETTLKVCKTKSKSFPLAIHFLGLCPSSLNT